MMTLGNMRLVHGNGTGDKSMKLSSLMLAAPCIVMLSVTGHAQADPYSANQVMKGCRAFVGKANSDVFLSGICVGSVSTLGAALGGLEKRAKRIEAGVCIPEEVTMGQEVRVVIAYIDARPNRLHEDFRDLALEASERLAVQAVAMMALRNMREKTAHDMNDRCGARCQDLAKVL